jgi:hypothetical protein
MPFVPVHYHKPAAPVKAWFMCWPDHTTVCLSLYKFSYAPYTKVGQDQSFRNHSKISREKIGNMKTKFLCFAIFCSYFCVLLWACICWSKGFTNSWAMVFDSNLPLHWRETWS